MPCKCDYLEPTKREKESVVVMGLLHEIGLIEVNDNNIYGNVAKLDQDTELLCQYCNEHHNISEESLDLQVWWRTHQEMDRKRILSKLKQRAAQAAVDRAMAKLTPEDKKALKL